MIGCCSRRRGLTRDPAVWQACSSLRKIIANFMFHVYASLQYVYCTLRYQPAPTLHEQVSQQLAGPVQLRSHPCVYASRR